MAKLSKYFTPILEERDKLVLLQLLGLDKASFQLVEEVLQQKVLIQNWDEEGAKTQILDPLFPDSSQSHLETQLAKIWVSHSSLVEDVEIGHSRFCLFDQIIPYPYSFFFREDTQNRNIRFSPPEFLKGVHDLRAVANQLGSQLANFELSVLWIRGFETSFPLLFHFGRKKLIRVGTLSSLHNLVEKFEQKQLSSADLRQFFGTQAAFFEVNLSQFRDVICPWERLTSAINRCLSHPSSKILGEPLHTPESPSFLDFEL